MSYRRRICIMTKDQLIAELSHIPGDTIVSAAVITWGEIDLENPEDIEMFRYVDEERYKKASTLLQ